MITNIEETVKNKIRTIKDFPKTGILFRDITTAIKDKETLPLIVDYLCEQFKNVKIDYIAGIESRGFIFGMPMAYKLGCGFVPVRKPNKLPAETISQEYELEYGTDKIEIHKDAFGKGDNVLIHSPIYVRYNSVLDNNGYKVITSEMKKDEKNIYRIDFEDMETKIKNFKIHVMIFCSPHNPCGRVWEKEELKKLSDLCEKYQISIISDEIWSDLILYNNKHIPFYTISDYAKNNTITLYAPSKTFNISGLVGAYHIIYNTKLRERYLKESSLCNYNEMNLLSMYSLIGAYKKEGYEWLEQLLKILEENIDYCVNYINEHFKGVNVSKPEGTYMLFVDCSEWCKLNKKTIDDVEKSAWRVGVSIQDGRIFNGPCHFRMNVALPLSKVKEALKRLDKYVFNKA